MSEALSRLVVWRSEGLVAYLHPRPWTPGAVILEAAAPGGGGGGGAPGGGLFHLPEDEYLRWLMGARAVAQLLCDKLGVRRCAMVTRPHAHTHTQIRVLPLHGLEEAWRPHLAAEEEHNALDPGYCTSKSGPRWSDSRLEETRRRVRSKLPEPDAAPDLSFLGPDPAHPGLFARIVRGEERQWRLWEDGGHVAFLTPFPNAPGLAVLVPRRPLPSDVFGLEAGDYAALAAAARKVAALLEEALGASGVAMIFEGFEIDYAHAKLIPLMGGGGGGAGAGDAHAPPRPRFYATYPGYVSSEDGPEAEPQQLRELHLRITQTST